MRIADVLPRLTIQPLRRFGDAWDVKPISAEKRVVEQAILGALDRINTEAAVRDRFVAVERRLDYVRRANAETVLRHLIDQPGYSAADGFEVVKRICELDAAFLEYAKAPTALRHLDPNVIDICQSILEVAWEDRVTFDEYRLIRRVEEKLGVCRRDHLVMEARITRRDCLTSQDAEEALRALNYEGFVCQFKQQASTQVIVPEEIAGHLRTIFGIVLQSAAYRNLASKLPMAVVKEVLEQMRQPAVSSKKEFLIDRIIDGDIPPAALLNRAEDKTLDELLASFPEQKPLSMRAVKVKHLITNFDRYSVRSPDSPRDDPDKVYYDYLEELAGRRYGELYAADIIRRDQNVDRFFERGVSYTFSTFLGHKPLEFKGSAHADGGVAARNGRMALWDCKSAVGPYALTDAKCGQFLRYIHGENALVSPFLVISGAFTDESANLALALKTKCPPGTEISLLTAGDLKWLADKWARDNPGKQLPLDVLAHTGMLIKDVLDTRLRLFASKADDKE